MSFKVKLLLGVFAGLMTLAVAMIFYFYQVFMTPNLVIAKDQRSQKVLIPQGTSLDVLMDTLRKRDVVHDEISFRFVCRFLDFETPRPGVYRFEKEMTNLTAVRMLRAGAQTPVKLTFNNARLPEDLAGKICDGVGVDSLDFLEKLRSPEVAAKYGFDTTTFVCMFIPNTYEVYWTLTADELLERMKKEYDKFWTEERRQKAEALNLTPLQVSILASIVQAETLYHDERARVAGVYLNRLNKGWKLEADPTVVFAHRDFSIRRVLNAHLELDSPYNTYKYTGLPPGPINVPELSSLKAVLNPEKHKYMYFCAKEDFSGYHSFAETLREHNNNANRYRRALNKRKILK